MIIKNEFRQNGSINDGTFRDMFINCVSILDRLLFIEESAPITEDKRHEIEKQEIDADYYMLDLLSEVTGISIADSTDIITLSYACKNNVIARRMTEGLKYLRQLIELSQDAVELYTPLEEDEVKRVKDLLSNTIGCLSFSIFKQFDMQITLDTLDTDRVDINNVIVNAADVGFPVFSYFSEDADMFTLMKELSKVVTKFKPTLELFEEYPELEEPFYDAVAEYAYDFTILEPYLTIDIIKEIVTKGVFTEEDYLELKERLESGNGAARSNYFDVL